MTSTEPTTLLITAADDGFLDFLDDLIATWAAGPLARTLPLAVLDVGLSEASRTRLHGLGIRTAAARCRSSARRSGWCRATAIRPSTCTTGISACAAWARPARAWKPFGRWPRGVLCSDCVLQISSWAVHHAHLRWGSPHPTS